MERRMGLFSKPRKGEALHRNSVEKKWGRKFLAIDKSEGRKKSLSLSRAKGRAIKRV